MPTVPSVGYAAPLCSTDLHLQRSNLYLRLCKMLYENTGNVDRFCNYASGNVWTDEDLRNPFATGMFSILRPGLTFRHSGV